MIGLDNSIEFDSRRGFPVKLELLDLGDPFVESIIKRVPFSGGFVASLMDLFLRRAVTVADRGDDRDVENFKWLLEAMVEKGIVLPCLGHEKVVVLAEGVEAAKLTLSDPILYGAVLSAEDLAKYLHPKYKSCLIFYAQCDCVISKSASINIDTHNARLSQDFINSIFILISVTC